MIRYAAIMLFFLVASCAPKTQYSWQDSRLPARDDASADISTCRDYAARQYQPGTPAGAPYLAEQRTPSDPLAPQPTGEWRPDRDPTRQTSIHSMPTHDIPVEYTGYPGELDYYPDYLDDIFEKCMQDKGWQYRPAKEE